MGVRKDLLAHKLKTIESFGLVKEDISAINANMQHINNLLASVEMRLSAFDNEVLSLKGYVKTCASDIDAQKSSTLSIQSKIAEIGKNITFTNGSINSIRETISGIFAQNKEIYGTMEQHKNLITNLSSKMDSQSQNDDKLSAKLKNLEREVKTVRSSVKRGIKTTKTAGLKLEKKIRSQRSRIVQLNRIIESRKIVAKRKPKKKFIKKITPKKTIKKTITPKKVVTETTTPSRKTITEIQK